MQDDIPSQSENQKYNKYTSQHNACEEVVIMEERCGGQDHHNQTMDGIYSKNQNPASTRPSNEDLPIKCNVVSNQLNFLNSINYRDKNDFNSSLAFAQQQQPQAPQKQQLQHSDSNDSSASGGAKKKNDDKDCEKEDLQIILQELFPGYQQHYWNDRSTWNPINKTGRTNDTFDASFHSIDLHIQVHNTTLSDSTKPGQLHQQSPFIAEDISVILDPKCFEEHVSLEGKVHETHDHFHNEMFCDGLSSLLFDRRSSINNNLVNGIVLGNTQGVGGYMYGVNTLSHSSDSQQKTLKNSLKLKVIGHSSNEVENELKEKNEKSSH